MKKVPIDPIISDYIDKSIERERAIFNADMRAYGKEIQKENREENRKEQKELLRQAQQESYRHMTALKEGFQHDVDLLKELISSKPDREDVRAIVHEEIKSFVTELSLVKGETIEHRRTLARHDKRLTKLENVLV